MTTNALLVVSRAVLLRLLQCFVYAPAIWVGVLALLLLAAGESPLRSAVEGLYGWGSAKFRDAPTGHVLESVCDERSREALNGDLTVCARTKLQPVPVAEAVDQLAGQLSHFYWLVVTFSAVVLLGALGPRRFVGMPPKLSHANAGEPPPIERMGLLTYLRSLRRR